MAIRVKGSPSSTQVQGQQYRRAFGLSLDGASSRVPTKVRRGPGSLCWQMPCQNIKDFGLTITITFLSEDTKIL